MQRVKKRKISVKKILLLVIPIVIFLAIFLNRSYLITLYRSKVTGYEFDTTRIFEELDIYKDIKKHDYSKTLEYIVKSEYYNPKYLNSYLDINYQDNDNFLISINTLLDLGYTTQEINTIYDSFSSEQVKLFTDNDYLKDILNILKLNYFNKDNIERYLVYNNKKDILYEDLVTYVNIGLDKDYYTDVINITKPNDIKVIVNKYHNLASNYIPGDLEKINNKYNLGNNNLMRHEARIHFEEMCEAARKDNIYIYSGSAYRSYSYQLNLYNRYVNRDGKKAADTYAARAGYSEHQTGLATDIMKKNADYLSVSDKEYTWLVNNSYKYGFILRYPKGKENITGYMYEEWHFRYVGIDTAKELYESKLTYDEYVARK